MSDDLRGFAPRWTGDAGPDGAEPELDALAALRAAGLPTGQLLLVPAAAEEAFYRLNGLPPRLRTLLAPIATTDPDEDDVEDLAPEARRAVEGHALLDTWVDAFLDALEAGPETVTVRRVEAPGAPSPATETVAAGRPALLALRRAWAAVWEFEAVLDRCRCTGSALPRPRGVVLHAPAVDEAASPLAARVREHVPGARAEVDAAGRVVRLRWAASAERPPPASAPG